MPPFSGFFPDEINLVMQEFVTPRCLATSASEYPSSCTAIHETVRQYNEGCGKGVAATGAIGAVAAAHPASAAQ